MNFPLEYEENIYRNMNAHLKQFSIQQLLEHDVIIVKPNNQYALKS